MEAGSCTQSGKIIYFFMGTNGGYDSSRRVGYNLNFEIFQDHHNWATRGIFEKNKFENSHTLKKWLVEIVKF